MRAQDSRSDRASASDFIMFPDQPAVEALCASHPGRTQQIVDFCTLLGSRDVAPPFIVVYDAFCPRRARNLITNILHTTRARAAFVHMREATNQAFLFENVMRQLIDSSNQPDREWTKLWTESIDGFCSGLRDVLLENESQGPVASISRPSSPTKKSPAKKSPAKKAKGRPSPRKSAAKRAAQDSDEEMDLDPTTTEVDPAVVLVIDAAQHVREYLPDLLVPLTRLAELARVDITTLFISTCSWSDIEPPFSASPDPYIVHLPPLDKEPLLATLTQPFFKASASAPVDGPYSSVLAGFFAKFIASLHDTCIPFVRDPDELAYLCAALWVPFVQPIVEAWRTRRAEHDMEDDAEPPAPNELTQMRFLRAFVSVGALALDQLYPRTLSPQEFAERHIAPVIVNLDVSFADPADLALPLSPTKPKIASGSLSADADAQTLVAGLPRVARFILVAAYAASVNPARSDVRMFGRVSEGKRRRGGGSKSRTKRSTATAKVPARLSGPAPFPLERLLALVGRLLEDYDAPIAEEDSADDEFDVGTVAREAAEMDVGRVQLLALISELGTLRLLHRTSSGADKVLDSMLMFKCGISQSVALALAKDIRVPLANFLCDDE